MKNFRIYTALLLAALVLFALGACYNSPAPLAVAAPEDGDIVLVDESEVILTITEDNPEDGNYEPDPSWMTGEGAPAFGSVTGEVVSIETNSSGDQLIKIEGEHGAAALMTYFNTLTLGGLETGDTVTGYFDMDMPMTLIYPPQHLVSVIVNNDTFQDDGLPFVHICRFFEREGSFGDHRQLISADGQLVINLGGDNTVVTLQDGEAFDGELAGRMLVVTYFMATFSIPPQTTPMQIIVLYERAVTGPEFVELPENWDHGMEDMAPHYDILIDGEGLVGAHVIFVGDDAAFPTHLELVPVAAALGAEVEWDRATGEVTLEGNNGRISFIVGSYDFAVGGETVTLNQPSVDFYGTVYVPVLFFSDVFGMASAYSHEGRIYIGSTAGDMR